MTGFDEFARIYRNHSWGGQSRSGPGSDLENLPGYVDFVGQTVRRLAARSILDIGCGDFSLARHVDFGSARYTGIDIVPDLIGELNQRFGSAERTFLCANIVTDLLPSAEMVICKDVLQHLSNSSVRTVLEKLESYPFVLMINDRCRHKCYGPLRRRVGKVNVETADGGSRPLRLREAPFNWGAEPVATFNVRYGRRWDVKEALLRRTSATPA